MQETAEKLNQDATAVLNQADVTQDLENIKLQDPTKMSSEMQQAKQKNSFKCSDIPVFKIIMGSCCLVCLIIGISILVWWMRVRRAAKAVVGAFDDIDWDSAISSMGDDAISSMGDDYPFDFPSGVMQEQTGTNLCVNSGSDTFAFKEDLTSKEDCLNECT